MHYFFFFNLSISLTSVKGRAGATFQFPKTELTSIFSPCFFSHHLPSGNAVPVLLLDDVPRALGKCILSSTPPADWPSLPPAPWTCSISRWTDNSASSKLKAVSNFFYGFVLFSLVLYFYFHRVKERLEHSEVGTATWERLGSGFPSAWIGGGAPMSSTKVGRREVYLQSFRGISWR